MSIGFITHPDCALHDMGTGHPECPARLGAIQDQILSSGMELALQYYDAPLATREQLFRVHDPAYVDEIFRIAPDEGRVYLDADTLMGPYSLNAALRAAGAAVLGVDLVMNGKNNQAFCSVRPPGHHAERHRAMGFCIFNNVAVGAAHARQQYQLQRVAIVDFDVHHGNGTEDIFRDDAGVLFCSTFQHPFYPHTGADTQRDHIVNVPLPAASGGQAFREAVEQYWLARLDAFKPELILVSAGFDGHVEDEMAGLALVENDYAWVTRQIKQLADRHASGRIVSTLEGGYALSALGRSVVAHLNAML
ncbi:histone deacetylase family protein [Thiohalophilus sp.]|uniref:histone deacetylase family protein n=1 Tax=Thiohalophilus sp. TaxID=3028392 RepID=UPI002ACDEA73|nr:histone deacetylase family protein [Thiohalophilus sp.]MDZ7804198.1 histone deacetylase family protein [Thiohalophilus sp.]